MGGPYRGEGWKRNRWNMEKKRGGGIGKRREDRNEGRGRGLKLTGPLFNTARRGNPATCQVKGEG